jgi:hemoglobin-like flavoprotein
MTGQEITLIRRTWKIFRDIDPSVVGDAFYSRLFTYQPGLRKMFPRDMHDQYLKLMNMLSIVVGRLDKLEVINDELTAMASRHVQYGVRPAHYHIVGKALLWTLEKGLGRDWTPEVEKAWQKCYLILSVTMINATKLNI